jgi:hypothetical protein
MKMQSISSSFLIKFRRFTTPQAPQLGERWELHHLLSLYRVQSGFLVALARFQPESSNQETPQGIPTTFPHLANRCSVFSFLLVNSFLYRNSPKGNFSGIKNQEFLYQGTPGQVFDELDLTELA